MYNNESYEDYIRNILGYPNYNNSNYENDYDFGVMNSRNAVIEEQLESCYPEIYKVVYPKIRNACSNNTRPITKELIEELTDEICLEVENNNEINININLTNEVQTAENRNTIENRKTENQKETRRFRNRGLQDLIKILLIREILGRPGRPGNRPPFPPNRPPVRPPFPGGPGGGRPPIMRPRYDNDFSNLYEM